MQERPGTFPKRAFADNNIRRSTVFPAHPHTHAQPYIPLMDHWNSNILTHSAWSVARAVTILYLRPLVCTLYVTNLPTTRTILSSCRNDTAAQYVRTARLRIERIPAHKYHGGTAQNRVSSAVVYRSSSVVPQCVFAPQSFNSYPLHNN